LTVLRRAKNSRAKLAAKLDDHQARTQEDMDELRTRLTALEEQTRTAAPQKRGLSRSQVLARREAKARALRAAQLKTEHESNDG
jgi:hypothetical protein